MSSYSLEEEEEEAMRSNVWRFLKMSSSYNSNVLLASIVSLLLVVLFFFLLHFYARFYWSASGDSRQRIRRRRTIRPAPILSGGSFISASATLQMSIDSAAADKGLDASVISSIPLFVYEDSEEEGGEGLECAICLGLWEVGDVGRKLRKCGHGFHVECVDMWLSSHSTCPLCRAPVLASTESEGNLKPPEDNGVNGIQEEVRVQVVSEDDDQGLTGCCLLCRAPVIETEDDRLEPGEVRVEVMSGEEEDGRRWMISRSRSERDSNKMFPSATHDSSQE